MKFFSKILTCLLLASFAMLAEARELTAVFTEKVPVIDGVLNDECWSQAEWQTGFTELKKQGKPEPEKERTRFKLVTTENGIFIAVDCNAPVIQARPAAHDAGVFDGDCVEVFIAPVESIPPDPMMWEFYQFAVNPVNARFDLHSQASVGNRTWDGPWKSAAGRTPSGWCAELFIPYGAIGSPTGKQWFFNIGRENPRTGIYTWCVTDFYRNLRILAPLKGLRFQPERFAGKMENLKVACHNADQRKFTEFTGEFACLPNQTYMLHGTLFSRSKMEAFKPVLVRTGSNGRAKFSLPLDYSRSGKVLLRLSVFDGRSQIFHQDGDYVLDFAPFSLKMAKLYRPEVICSKQPDKKVAFSCDFLLPENQYRKCHIFLTVRNKDGKLFHQEERKVSRAQEKFVFDAAAYPFGKYQIELSVRDGSRVLGTLRQPLHLVRPHASETWLNQKLQTVVNGKAIYPVGFMGHLPWQGFDMLKGSGCNIAHSYHNFPVKQCLAFLDDAQRHGLKLMFYPYLGMESGSDVPFTAAQWEGMKKYVDAIKDHPAFLGWFAFDEPYTAGWIENIRETYRRLREWDPAHAIFGDTNRAVMCVQIGELTDVIMLDYYPCPRQGEGNERPIATIYNGMKLMQRELRDKGIWNIPQAFDYEEFYKTNQNYRAPTYVESRCAVYASIVGGATGLLPFIIGSPATPYYQPKKGHAGIHSDPELKIGYLEGICPEIRALEQVLLADDAEGLFTAGHRHVLTMGKIWQGRQFLFAVNHRDNALGKVELRLRDGARRWKVLGENRTVEAEGKILVDDFGPNAVHVYTDDLDFRMPVDMAAVQAKIQAVRRKYGR